MFEYRNKFLKNSVKSFSLLSFELNVIESFSLLKLKSPWVWMLYKSKKFWISSPLKYGLYLFLIYSFFSFSLFMFLFEIKLSL